MAAPFAHIFAPLAEVGAYAQIVDADLDGNHNALLTDKNVVHIHMTGSGATHDKVVKSLHAAKRDKDVLFTSELGCVSPWIVCPGKLNGGVWTDSSITHHATMLASAFKSSCSMNCLSPKVLVLPPENVWPQRAKFLTELKTKLASMVTPPPYYPGAHQRYANFQKEYANAEQIDAPPAQVPGQGLEKAEYEQLGQNIAPLPSLLVDVGTIGESSCKSYALKNEAFAPVLAIGTVKCGDAAAFPLAAAHAVNEHVFGTLSCNLIYPDEPDEQLDEVVNVLNYGAISVNYWAALSYSNALIVWGGAPGSYKASASCSGLGFVGNAARIPRPLKAVGFGPFVNKGVAMDAPMPYLLADALTLLISGKASSIPGILFKRGFGLIPKKFQGSRCA